MKKYCKRKFSLYPLWLQLLRSLAAVRRSKKDGGRRQKLMLFIRGNAISGAPIIKVTRQLPKPPIIIGITIKKINE